MAPTHSQPSERTTAKNGTRLLKPAIGLARPSKSEENKTHDEKIKCRTNPADAESTTYEIPMSYFRDGTPEEWLLFKKKLTRCMSGQNATGGPTKYALARRLLAGRALADFNHAATLHANETVQNYTRCIAAVTLGVFPQKALQDQKRWMRRFLKKPREMPVREYIARVIEINDYLEEFPPTTVGGDATKLPEDELLDLLEFGIPIKWQRQMQVQNFVPTAGTLREFQDFCERLEAALEETPADPQPKQVSEKGKGNKKRRCNQNDEGKGKHFCMLHGQNSTHSTEQCRTLKKEADKFKKGRENGDKSKNRCEYVPSKEEIHALAAFAKEQMAKEVSKVDEELKNFENMSVSDDGSA